MRSSNIFIPTVVTVHNEFRNSTIDVGCGLVRRLRNCALHDAIASPDIVKQKIAERMNCFSA
ncbi:MAG TPA: hypothetical protein VFB14_22715 [Bryobacteraceae bacterium]|nr:hypothetical protein [Bryobacteraceae bacterium]